MSTTPIPKKPSANDLTQKELNLLEKSSKLGRKEIQMWHKDFVQNHPTGKIDKKEFCEIFKKLHPNETETAVTQAFNAVDQNGDETIDFNEFIFCVAVGNRVASLDDRLEAIFELWDVSNDGQLDVNELAHLISAMYDRAHVSDRQGDKNPTIRAKEIIKKLDASGDKKLNLDEFVKGLKGDQVIADLLAPK